MNFVLGVITGLFSNYLYNLIANKLNIKKSYSKDMDLGSVNNSQNDIVKRVERSLDIITSPACENISYRNVEYILGLHKFEYFNEIINRDISLEIRILKKYSMTFGVSFEWLLSGEESPFRKLNPTLYLSNHFKEILHDVKCFYFAIYVDEKLDFAEVGIVIQESEYCYSSVASTVTLRKQFGKGQTGLYQLLDLYNLISRIAVLYGEDTIKGIKVNKDLFRQIVNGEVHGSICDDDSDKWYLWALDFLKEESLLLSSVYGEVISSAKHIVETEKNVL